MGGCFLLNGVGFRMIETKTGEKIYHVDGVEVTETDYYAKFMSCLERTYHEEAASLLISYVINANLHQKGISRALFRST